MQYRKFLQKQDQPQLYNFWSFGFTVFRNITFIAFCGLCNQSWKPAINCSLKTTGQTNERLCSGASILFNESPRISYWFWLSEESYLIVSRNSHVYVPYTRKSTTVSKISLMISSIIIVQHFLFKISFSYGHMEILDVSGIVWKVYYSVS